METIVNMNHLILNNSFCTQICQFVLQVIYHPLRFSGMGLFYFGNSFLWKVGFSRFHISYCMFLFYFSYCHKSRMIVFVIKYYSYCFFIITYSRLHVREHKSNLHIHVRI